MSEVLMTGTAKVVPRLQLLATEDLKLFAMWYDDWRGVTKDHDELGQRVLAELRRREGATDGQ